MPPFCVAKEKSDPERPPKNRKGAAVWRNHDAPRKSKADKPQYYFLNGKHSISHTASFVNSFDEKNSVA